MLQDRYNPLEMFLLFHFGFLFSLSLNKMIKLYFPSSIYLQNKKTFSKDDKIGRTHTHLVIYFHARILSTLEVTQLYRLIEQFSSYKFN